MIERGETILEVRELRTAFNTEYGLVKAVDGISFSLRRGEILGIVGESGCGKSVTNLSILRLVPDPPGKITGGQILYKGKDLLEGGEDEMRLVRGGKVSMIFQDPMTSLNPLLRVSLQIAEALQLHRGMGRREAEAKAVELLSLIGIPDAEARARDYPHQFSGGMRQRVMIAMAISCNPDILIADEPTTALDVTIQAQILELVKSLSAEKTMSVILVTHDLGVVAGVCDSILVMYAGRIVERGPVGDIFADPKHPYTRGLMDSVPRADSAGAGRRLYSIPGAPPDLAGLPPGCPFRPRCEKAMDICEREYPPEAVFSGPGGAPDALYGTRCSPGGAPEASGTPSSPTRSAACWLHAPQGRVS